MSTLICIVRRSAIWGAAAASGGCGGGVPFQDSVAPEVIVVDRTTQELALGSLSGIDGTYGSGCAERTGAWSLGIGTGPTLANPILSVVRGNAACALTLTHLHTAGGAFASSPSIAMTDTYKTPASSFSLGSVTFFANAELSDSTFMNDFVITILYSDDAAGATAGNTAITSMVQSTATTAQVAAPSYSFSAAPIIVSVGVDNVVVTATGFAQLTDGTVTGEGYVVDMGLLLASPTYADIDRAYAGGAPVGISGANPTIPAAAFGLAALDLTTPKIRTVIVAHQVSGVRSYEIVSVAFNTAAP